MRNISILSAITFIAIGINSVIAQTQTQNYIPRFTASPPTVENSMIYNTSNTFLGVGTTAPLLSESFSFKRSYNGWTGMRVFNSLNSTLSYAGYGATAAAVHLYMNAYPSSYIATSNMDLANSCAIYSNGTAGMQIGTTSNSQLSLWTNNLRRLSIDNLGYVGVGTNTPSQKLHVSGGNFLVSGADNFISSGHRAYAYLGNTDYSIYGEHSSGIRMSTAGFADILSINNNGNIVFKHLNNINLAIGASYDAQNNGPLWGNAYLGFNMERTGMASWIKKSDGGNNGGSIIWGGLGGEFYVSTLPNTVGGSVDDPNVTSSNIIDYRALSLNWNSTLPTPNGGTGGPQVKIGKGLASSSPHYLDYSLAVPGKVVATSVYVTMSNWADYVFEESYKLPSINELEKFIIENKHLPNVPATGEVINNGNNVGETERILLEKIEELSLYIIQLNKRIEELEKK